MLKTHNAVTRFTLLSKRDRRAGGVESKTSNEVIEFNNDMSQLLQLMGFYLCINNRLYVSADVNLCISAACSSFLGSSITRNPSELH